jgi:radical SAM protein with 4Fe4S-binding SPASM domain
MTNLLLTYKCNRSCPYCFAQERQKAQSPDGEMYLPWSNLVTAVNYIVEDRQDMVSVLGGEPTLHPEFVDIYRYIVARDLTVKMFSNGCVSHEKIEALLKALNPDKSRFIINVNEERDRQSFETKMQAEFFRELGMVSALSFNLFRPDPDLDFLLDLIGEYQLRRRIRIGLAHPIAGEPNAFLRPEQYADIAARLADFARRANHQDVNLSLDCGFTLCDFTDEQLGMLHRTGAIMRFHCGPIIDIGPDLNTWACFPLSSLRPQPLEEYPSLQALKKFFAEYIRSETRQRRFAGVYKKCESCRYLKRNMCSGGCRSYAFEEKS